VLIVLSYRCKRTNRKIVMQWILSWFRNPLYILATQSPTRFLRETMIWFPASKFLIFSVLLAANPATAEEFQIHQPRTMVSAEHTTVATDIGQTTGLRSPISKAPAHWNPSEILPSRFHATYSLDLPCYHEDRNKWFGLEGSHCMIGYSQNSIWRILNIRKSQGSRRLNCICHWRRTDAEDCPFYWRLLGTPWHQSRLSQHK